MVLIMGNLEKPKSPIAPPKLPKPKAPLKGVSAKSKAKVKRP